MDNVDTAATAVTAGPSSHGPEPCRLEPPALEAALASDGATFGIDMTDVRLEAADTNWSWGSGRRLVHAASGPLVALLSGRTLPDGRKLPRS